LTSTIIAGMPEPLDQYLVYVAPSPLFAWLERPDYRVPGGVEMFRGMFVLRVVATTHVAAGQAFSEVDPRIAQLQALLAAIAAWFHVSDLALVRAPPG
jgi:hypothetical protein